MNKLVSTLGFLLRFLLSIAFAPLALAVTYLLALTGASLFGGRRKPGWAPPRTRFAVLIPAHDEETVIAETLRSLTLLDYPAEQFDVHVVADNCQDRTADVARGFDRALALTVHERDDRTRQGKGYAIEWLLAKLFDRPPDEPGYDAFVMLDADWTVSPNFLAALNARLQHGADIVQVWCRVARPEESWLTGLRSLTFGLVNYIRPLGVDALGLSCGLKGTGMAFTATVLRENGWHSYSLIEDAEQHIKLLLAGQRVTFAPEAFIEGRMPASLGAAHSQQLRWESGKLALVRDHTWSLLRIGVGTGNLSLLHEVIALLIPPLSVLAALCAGTVGAAWLLGSKKQLIVALGMLGGLTFHVGAGVVMTRPSRSVYLSLLMAPLFIIWKLRLYASALRKRGQGPWVRTRRPGEVLR